MDTVGGRIVPGIFLVLMVLKLVYLVAHDNVMATLNVLYINDIHILF